MSVRPPTSTSSIPGSRQLGTGHSSAIPRTARTKTGQLTTGGVGVGLATDMNVEMRPVTREGMHAVGVGKKGPERQVQDKTFWLSALRTRIKELEDELQKLTTNTQKLQKDATQEFSLAKKMKESESEVQQLHDEFRDWNLAVEKLQEHGDDPTEQLEKDVARLAEKNEKSSEEADLILRRKIDKEEKIQQLREEIQKVDDQFQERLSQHPGLQQTYHTLKEEEKALDRELETAERNVLAIEMNHNQLYAQLQSDPEKIRYLERLKEKKDLMTRDRELKKSIRDIENEGADEKEGFKRTMAEVKEIQKESEKISAAINAQTSLLKEKEKKLNEFTGPKAQKFKEYQQKEQQIMEVVQSYPSQKKELTQKLQRHQEMIVELLDHISSNLVDKDNIPSVSQMNSMQDSLSRKKEEYERSKTTFERLQLELEDRKEELEKMKTLDKKIDQDLKTTSENIHRMNSELKIYENTELLKTQYEELKKEMEKYKEEQLILKEAMQRQVNNLSRTLTHTQKRMQNNTTFENLTELQKKIRVYEQNNHSLREYILTKGSETDYTPLRQESLSLVNELNKINVQWAST